MLRITNNKEIEESELNIFIENFGDEYLRNKDFRDESEGKYIIFYENRYYGKVEIHELYELKNLGITNLYIVEINNSYKCISYEQELIFNYIENTSFPKNEGKKSYSSEICIDDTFISDKISKGLRTNFMRIQRISSSISFRKTKYVLNKINAKFYYDLGSENIHILGGKFFNLNTATFILDERATQEEIEKYYDEFEEWNKRLVATSPTRISGSGDRCSDGLILHFDPPLYLCMENTNPTPCSRFVILLKRVYSTIIDERPFLKRFFSRNSIQEENYILEPFETMKNLLFGLPGIRNYKTEIYPNIDGDVVIKIKDYVTISKPIEKDLNYSFSINKDFRLTFLYNILDPYEKQELFEIFRLDKNFTLFYLNIENKDSGVTHDMKFGVLKELLFLEKYKNNKKYSYITKVPIFLIRIRDFKTLHNKKEFIQNIINCNYIDGYISNNEEILGEVEIFLKEPHRLIEINGIFEDNSIITDEDYRVEFLQKEQEIINNYINHSVDCDRNFEIIDYTLDLNFGPPFFVG